jgi:hypothetical protein
MLTAYLLPYDLRSLHAKLQRLTPIHLYFIDRCMWRPRKLYPASIPGLYRLQSSAAEKLYGFRLMWNTSEKSYFEILSRNMISNRRRWFVLHNWNIQFSRKIIISRASLQVTPRSTLRADYCNAWMCNSFAIKTPNWTVV